MKAYVSASTRNASVETLPATAAWQKKHFLLFQVQTLGGDLITINRNSDTNKVKIIHAAGESKVKIANIETKFGLVYVIDKPIN